MTLIIGDTILALLLFALGGYVYGTAATWPDYSRLSVLGPEMGPKLLGIAFIIAGVLLLLQGANRAFIKKVNAEGENYVKKDVENAKAKFAYLKKQWKGVIALIALPIMMWIYATVLPTVGFEICTVLFMVLALLICQERRWYLLVGVPVGVTVVIYLLFRLLLNVPLPLLFL